MKKLLLLVLTVFTVDAFAVRGSLDAAGAVKTRDPQFLTVVNSAASALTIGMGVCLDLTADDGISVDFCAASGNKPLCMVVDSSCAVGARCKCLKEGYFAKGKFGAGQGNAVAGNVIYAHTSGHVYGDTTPGDLKFPLGVALDASSATGDLEVYVDL